MILGRPKRARLSCFCSLSSRLGLACVLLLMTLGGIQIRAGSIYTPYAFTNFAGKVGVLGTADATGDQARFSTPVGVATDSAGNVYVADGANTIRKISPSGAVITLAGSAGLTGTNDGSAQQHDSTTRSAWRQTCP